MRVRFCPERSASVSQQYANLVLTIYVVRSYWVKMAIFAPMRAGEESIIDCWMKNYLNTLWHEK